LDFRFWILDFGLRIDVMPSEPQRAKSMLYQ